MKSITTLTLIACIICTTSIKAQESDTETPFKRFSWGLDYGISSYTLKYDQVPVNQYRKIGFSGGFYGFYQLKNQSFLKFGIEATDYKSPFENGISVYDYYTRIPIMYSFTNRTSKKKNYFTSSIGPSISFLTQQGIAQSGEDVYTNTNSKFGSLIKYGLVSELAWYTWGDRGLKHAFGIRAYADINGWFTKNDPNVNVRNNYIGVTFFYTLGSNR